MGFATLSPPYFSYHGAEFAYVFGNFVPPGWPWTDADRKLSEPSSNTG